jgi:hypothetical protein
MSAPFLTAGSSENGSLHSSNSRVSASMPSRNGELGLNAARARRGTEIDVESMLSSEIDRPVGAGLTKAGGGLAPRKMDALDSRAPLELDTHSCSLMRHSFVGGDTLLRRAK